MLTLTNISADIVLLEGVVRQSGAETTVNLPHGQAIAPASSHRPGTKLLVALRPERIHIAEGQGPNRLACIVETITYAGATVEIAARLQDNTEIRLIRPAEAPLLTQGQPITIGWQPDAARLLTQ
eukprot:gene1804-1834_t